MGFFEWLLWFQTAYSIWQFVRVAKFFRLPYCLLNNLVNASLGYAGAWPFQACKFCVVRAIAPADVYSEMGGAPSFLSPPLGVSVASRRNEYVLDDPLLGRTHFISSNLYTRYNSIRSYLSFRPTYVCTNVDLLIPGFYILDTLRHNKAIEVVMSGAFKLEHFSAKCVSTLDKDLELNQNFLRLLSIFPLTLQAKGYDKVSLFISLAIIVLDQLSIVANLVWKKTLRAMYWYYKSFLFNKVPRPMWRYYLSVWLGSVSANFLCSDESTYSFKFINPGDTYPTMLDKEVNADFAIYGEPVIYDYSANDISQYKVGDAKEVHYGGGTHHGDFEIYQVLSRGNEIRLYINESGTFFCKCRFQEYCHGVGYHGDTLVHKLRLIEVCEMLPVRFIKGNIAQVISMEHLFTSKLAFIQFFKASTPFHIGMSTTMY